MKMHVKLYRETKEWKLNNSCYCWLLLLVAVCKNSTSPSVVGESKGI